MQFPSGIFSDEKGGKPGANFGIFIFASAFLLMSVTYSYFTFLIALDHRITIGASSLILFQHG
jgi:hypothetical protein